MARSPLGVASLAAPPPGASMRGPAIQPWLPATTDTVLAATPSPPRRQWGLGVWLAGLSFLVSLFWVAAIHPFAAPDEPAHFLAVLQVRNYHILPEVHYDFSQDPRGLVVNTPVDPAAMEYIRAQGQGDPVRAKPNESFHPPLYYFIVSLLTLPLPADARLLLYASRLVSALFGAGTVYFCWAAAREFAPRSPVWAVATAGVILLLPQFCFNRSVVTNDTAVNCAGAAVFYLWFRGLRDPEYDRWMLRAGLAGGLAILASLSGAVLLPGLALVILFRAFQVRAITGRWRARGRRALRMVVGAGVAGVAVAGWWFIRNIFIYGEPTGLQNAVRYAKVTYPLMDFNDPAVRENFLQSIWKSSWGVFGWFDQLLPDVLYQQAGFFAQIGLSLSLLALAILCVRILLRRTHLPTHAWQASLVMALVAITLVSSDIQFSATVGFQPQGRLLFLVLLPAGLLFTGGVYVLAPGRVIKVVALSVLIVWLAYMNAVSLAVVR
jgi:hypothetical protein